MALITFDEIRTLIDELAGDDGWRKQAARDEFASLFYDMADMGLEETAILGILRRVLKAAKSEYGE